MDKESESYKKERIAYLKESQRTVRNEIEIRIGQRNTFSIQFIVAIGAILTLGFLDFKYSSFLFFLMPLVTIYYTTQILYTYDLHDRCHRFLVEEIEPELCKLLEFDEIEKQKFMWESYCDSETQRKAVRNPGTRKRLFQVSVLVMPIIASLLFFFVSYERALYETYILIIAAVLTFALFMALSIFIVAHYSKKK